MAIGGATHTAEQGASAEWRRAHAGSGLTTLLILSYVERGAGRGGVEQVLRRAGLQGREPELRDEDSWFSFDEKIRLWEAAQAVTGDRRIAERVGESALDFRVGLGLKRALRALGSPDFVYRNVVRANSKFNWAHTLKVSERQRDRVRLVYRDASGVGYHRYDCDYTIGLLRTVPQLFGLPAARVGHPVCGARGDDHCEFEVQWVSGLQRTKRVSLLSGAAAAALVAVGAAVDPALLWAGLGCGGVVGGAAAGRTALFMRRRIRALETRVREQELAADAQLKSLAALSSALRLDEVLDRVTASATGAIAGAHFALLIAEAGQMRAYPYSEIPPQSLRLLEQWAQESREALGVGPIVIDDLATVPSLRPLSTDGQLPLGSACAAPLLFGDRLLGALLALTPGATVFLPHDVRALETYAGHAAIALSNARLVEQLEREAAEDPLTGLVNKRVFQLACENEVDRAARQDASVALVVLDIDHFKEINDTYGHPFGDQVLITVAEALRLAVRGHDTVARLGGEEFALLLPGADLDDAVDVAERARAHIAAIELPRGELSSSAGVAVMAPSGAQPSDLFDAADRALYQAKRQGRGRTAVAPAPV